jgi:2-C-methyl-D-erythritol 4-phosphate cytidylyltransferase
MGEGGSAIADVGVIIAAAGRSERAGTGGPKQFRTIAGVPMVLRAVRPFARHHRVRDVVIALPSAVVQTPPPWLSEIASGRVRLVPGGETRTLSVRSGLGSLNGACEIVLVHDAARPFVSYETVDAVIATAARGVGAVPAIAVSDTLKRADGPSARIAETVDRTGLWCAHTPQGFPRAMLEDAYRRAEAQPLGRTATDEAALVEAAGYPVELVGDRRSNIKVTTPDDFLLAEALAAS